MLFAIAIMRTQSARWGAVFLLALGLLLGLTSIANADAPDEWVEFGANPIFGQGHGGPKAYYPSVVYDPASFSDHGDAYPFKMWFGTSGSRTGYAVSDDGVHWITRTVPITEIVGYHPRVLYDPNGFGNPAGPYYKMWYWAVPITNPFTPDDIYYAYSWDGITWTNYVSNPVITEANLSGYSEVYDAMIIYNPDGQPAPYQAWCDNNGKIYYITSTNGVDWSTNSTPVLTADDPTGTLSRVSVWRDADGTYHMWYGENPSGGGGNKRINHATSPDGVNWTKDPANPIFSVDDGIPWRDSRTYTPLVLYDADRFGGDDNAPLFRMWFTGKDSANGYYSLGLASPPPARVWVDDDYCATCVNDGHTWGYDAFATVGEGVAHVMAGGTVHVAAGVYTESITLDKDGLTLQGEGNGSRPVLDGGGTAVNVILIAADYVTVDGFEVRHGTGDLIRQSDAYTGTVVSNNVVHGSSGDEAIQLKYCVACRIENNTVYDTSGDGISLAYAQDGIIGYNDISTSRSPDGAIYVYNSQALTITGNTIHDCTASNGIKFYRFLPTGTSYITGNVIISNTFSGQKYLQDGNAILLYKPFDQPNMDARLLVQGNVIAHNSGQGLDAGSTGHGIYWHQAEVTGAPIAVEDNHIIGNGGHGFYLDVDSTLTGTVSATFSGNIVRGNGGDGLRLSAPSALIVAQPVHGNTFCGNGGYGLNNLTVTYLDATGNWWGTPTPQAGTEVTGPVDFNPWMDFSLTAPAQAQVGRSTPLTVTIAGGGYTAPDGSVVNWTASRGNLPLTGTTSSGVATALLTGITTPGHAVVTASEECGAVVTAVIAFVPGPPAALTITAQHTLLPADGESSTVVTVTVRDAYGNPVDDGTPVVFQTTLGSMAPLTTTTDNGLVTATLTATTTAGTARVSAVCDGRIAQVDVQFEPGPPAHLTLTANPTALTADGVSTSTLTVQVTDAYGNAVDDGTPITFTTNAGRFTSLQAMRRPGLGPAGTLLSPQQVVEVTAGGVAQTVLVAPTTVGEATVTAVADGAGDDVQITFLPGPPATLTLTVSPTTIAADGVSTATLAAQVVDAHGNAVSDDTVVHFMTTRGYVSPAYARTKDGVARSTLTASTTPGAGLVAAFCGAGDDAVEVAFIAGPVDFSASRKEVSAVTATPGDVLTYTIVVVNGGPSDVDVLLYDPLPDGVTYVEGSATGGAVPAEGMITTAGATLTASDTVKAILWHSSLSTGEVHTVTFAVRVGEYITPIIRNVAELYADQELGYTIETETYILAPGPRVSLYLPLVVKNR